MKPLALWLTAGVMTLVACTPAPAASPTSPPAPTTASPPAQAPSTGASPGASPAASAVPASPVASPAAAASPAASLSAPSPAVAGPTTSVAMSYSETVPDQLPGYAAKDAGTFAQSGLNVDFLSISSTNGIAALLSGQVQFALIGGSQVVSADLEGGDIEVLTTIVPYYTYVLEAPPSIQSATDLKGKIVGVAGVGSSTDIGMRLALSQLGLVPDTDVTVLVTGSTANTAAALKSGGIQGAVAHPPDSFDLEASGFHPLLDLTSQHIPAVLSGLAVRKSYADSHRDVVQKVVDSLVQVTLRIKSDRAFGAAELGKFLQSSDTELMQKSLDYYADEVYPDAPYPSTDQLKDAVVQLQTRNSSASSFDLSTAIDRSYVQNAVDRGLTPGA